MRDRLRAVLQLNAVPGIGKSQLCTIFDRLAATGLDVDELLSLSNLQLVERFGLTPDQAEAILSAEEHSSRLANRVRTEKVQLITRADKWWPKNLLKDSARYATPWLFVLGDRTILEAAGMAIVGSRDASPGSIDCARGLASALAMKGYVIVSGGARGIDRSAHDAAIEAGGKTIVVLAQGIQSFRVPWEWQSAIDSGQIAVVSEYMPFDEWEGFRAIQRNATIVQMSESLLVAHAGLTGGTVTAAQSALRMRWPLHVVRQIGVGAEILEGNEALIGLGGEPLPMSPNRPVADDLLEALSRTKPIIRPGTTQLGLFS